MATMRQRNRQYFVEWALINSGATFGTTVAGRTKLSIYFGTNLCTKAVRKQSPLLPIEQNCCHSFGLTMKPW